MEHRWNPRKEITSPVMVYQERIGLIRAEVKNISANGMLVNLGQSALSKGAVVELVGATLRRFQSKVLRLRALIVHTDEGLAGLMFLDAKETIAALWKALEDNYCNETYPSADGMTDDMKIGNSANAVAYASH